MGPQALHQGIGAAETCDVSVVFRDEQPGDGNGEGFPAEKARVEGGRGPTTHK